jgi:hypothetical protein
MERQLRKTQIIAGHQPNLNPSTPAAAESVSGVNAPRLLNAERIIEMKFGVMCDMAPSRIATSVFTARPGVEGTWIVKIVVIVLPALGQQLL